MSVRRRKVSARAAKANQRAFNMQLAEMTEFCDNLLALCRRKQANNETEITQAEIRACGPKEKQA